MEQWWTANAIVGWVFASAGAAKLLRLQRFARELRDRAPALPALPAALTVALVEVACGVYMLIGDDVRGAALLVLLLLATFSFAVLDRRGETCGCGGLAEFHDGLPHAVANLVLAAIAAAITVAGPASSGWSLTRAVAAYLALAALLIVHNLSALHDVRSRRLLVDQQRFGG